VAAFLTLFAGLGMEMPAQDKGKPDKGKLDKGKPVVDKGVEAPVRPQVKYKLRSAVRTGYTRPGAPPDTINKDGKVRPVAWDPDFTGKLIGGTIYFAVLERTGNEGDSWGSGVDGFNDRFVEGKSFRNNYSPGLDKEAKYLYLYQVVNDRGLDPPSEGVVPAGFPPKDLRSLPIAGTALRLIVDPRYITSWGHFRGVGFNATVPDRDRKGDIREAADKTPEILPIAFSSNPSILSELPYHKYLDPSPAYPLRELRDSFGLGSAGLNLRASSAYAELLKKKKADAKAVSHFEENMLQSAVQAKEPDFVQIIYSGSQFQEGTQPATGILGGMARPVDPTEIVPHTDTTPAVAIFRADWRGANNNVKLGFHSVVYGFTTDLPPTDEPIRIEDPEAALKGAGVLDGIRPAADGLAPGVVPALAAGVAPGMAPTPVPAPASATPVAGGAGAGLLGGGPIGVAGGMPMGGGAGAFGGARPPIMGGGGGGFFGGGGAQDQQQPQDQNQTGSQIINVNNSQSQSQNQSQQQQQQQQQSQQQSIDQGVIPEPGAIILALLGLPGLWLAQRRFANRATVVA